MHEESPPAEIELVKFLQTSRRAPGRRWWRVLFWWSGVRGLVHVFFKFVYRIQLRGSENVPPTGPIIYLANHQSNFDPCLVGLPTGDRPLSGMARASLFKNRLLAWTMHGIGAIELERGKGDAGAMKAALAELAAGRCVLIFPEGTRTPDGAIGEFQRGVMLLIKRSGAQVVPVAIEGAFDIWPIGTPSPKLKGRIGVEVGLAMPAEEILRDGPDAGLERLKRTIEQMRLGIRSQLRRSTGGRYPAPGKGDEPYWQLSSR
jgi:1-acyl-sn-glycerol-3-phosphate acyltransferase